MLPKKAPIYEAPDLMCDGFVLIDDMDLEDSDEDSLMEVEDGYVLLVDEEGDLIRPRGAEMFTDEDWRGVQDAWRRHNTVDMQWSGPDPDSGLYRTVDGWANPSAVGYKSDQDKGIAERVWARFRLGDYAKPFIHVLVDRRGTGRVRGEETEGEGDQSKSTSKEEEKGKEKGKEKAQK